MCCRSNFKELYRKYSSQVEIWDRFALSIALYYASIAYAYGAIGLGPAQ
jgi:hypothetical protein